MASFWRMLFMFLVSTSAFYLHCIYKPNFLCEIRNMYKRLYRDYLLASKRSYHSWTVRFILIRSLCLSLRIGLIFFALIDILVSHIHTNTQKKGDYFVLCSDHLEWCNCFWWQTAEDSGLAVSQSQVELLLRLSNTHTGTGTAQSWR